MMATGLPHYIEEVLDERRLRRRPTLHQGHTDNLKFDNGRYRIWLSRMNPIDWTGAGLPPPDGFPLSVEALIAGVWTTVYGDGA